MKTNLLYALVLLLLPVASRAQDIHLSSLNLGKKQTYYIRQGDSSIHLTIDTLVMKKGARIIALGKKSLVLTAGLALIDNNCQISGDDSRNNGTNIDLRINLQKLTSLYINVTGRNFNDGNRNYPIGHGGNVTVHYLKTGIKPQLEDSREYGYLSIRTDGGKGSVNPNADMSIIRDQIRSGAVPGRPLSALPQGTVFQGSDGQTGKVNVEAVEHL